jgi:hypothetical protein
LLVGGWWYLYIRVSDPETFNAIASKETSNWASYNVKPFYYYWSFFTQSGIWTIPAFIGLLYPYLKSRVSNLKAYKFSLLWTLSAVILLSLIPEKKARYLMPVLIPLAINTGFYIEFLIRNFKTIKDKRQTIPVYFNFSLIACIGILFPFIGFGIGPFLKGGILIWFILASLVLVTLGILILVQLKKKNLKQVFFLCIAFIVSVLITVLPLAKIQGQPNFHPISQLNADVTNQGLKVYSFNYIAPELIWHFGDKIPPIMSEDSVIHFPNEPKFGILANSISAKDKAILEGQYDLEKIATYDLNTSEPDSKKYNDRLACDYYILTKR